MTVAAEHRSDEDGIPDWLAALWRMVFVLEAVWVILANLAAAGYGVAIVRTDVLPSWLGWAAIAVGLGIPTIVLLVRDGFPHLALPVPLALAVALLLS